MERYYCENTLNVISADGAYDVIGRCQDSGELNLIETECHVDDYNIAFPSSSYSSSSRTEYPSTGQISTVRYNGVADAVVDVNSCSKLSEVIDSVICTNSLTYLDEAATNFDEEFQRICPTESSEHWNAEIGPTKRKKEATIVQCEYCLTVLKHPSKIDAHMRTHTGEKPFQCHICHRKFTQRTPLRMHVRRHNNELPFECSWGCGKRFVSNAVKNAHELSKHLGEKRQGPPQPHLKPPKCFIPLRNSDLSAAHGHSSILDWQVPLGEIKVQRPLSAAASKKLDDVIDSVASGMPLSERKSRGKGSVTIECHLCGLILKYPSKIKAHMRTHSGERPFLCDHCGMQCSTRNSLRVHIRRAHTDERPYECTWECGKNFVTIAARNEHERIVHSGIKRYICTVGNCRRLFTRRQYLLAHNTKHHSDMLPGVSDLPENNFTCESPKIRKIPSKIFERSLSNRMYDRCTAEQGNIDITISNVVINDGQRLISGTCDDIILCDAEKINTNTDSFESQRFCNEYIIYEVIDEPNILYNHCISTDPNADISDRIQIFCDETS